MWFVFSEPCFYLVNIAPAKNPGGDSVATTLITLDLQVKMFQTLLSEKNSADAALSGWQKMLSKAGLC